MEKKTLRIGVVGLGQIAQMEWLPYLHELGEYTLCALCDVSSSLVKQMAKLWNVPGMYTDWREMLKNERLDALVVLTINHTEICVAAAEAGLHLLIEKPLCDNLEQAELIRQAVVENHVTLMIGEMKRYDPGYLLGRNLIRNMKGLKLIRVRDYCDGLRRSQDEIMRVQIASDVPELLREKNAREHREAMIQLTGGRDPALVETLLMGGVHDVDLLRDICGEPEKVDYCDIWNHGADLLAHMTVKSGARAVLEVGKTQHKWFDEEIIAYGEEATVSIRFPNPYLKNAPTRVVIKEHSGTGYQERELTVSYDEAFRRELLHFYNCVVNKKLPDTCIEEGTADIRLIQRIFSAYRQGGKEEIE